MPTFLIAATGATAPVTRPPPPVAIAATGVRVASGLVAGAALHTGRIDMLPVKLKTLKVRERHLTYVYIRCKGQTAIHRRGAGDIWQGLWEPLLIDNGQLIIDNYDYFPGGIQTETPEPKRKTNHNSQFSILNSQLLKRGVRHQLTHQTLIADFYLLETTERPPLPDDYIWIDEKEFDRYAKPRLIELLLQSLP